MASVTGDEEHNEHPHRECCSFLAAYKNTQSVVQGFQRYQLGELTSRLKAPLCELGDDLSKRIGNRTLSALLTVEKFTSAMRETMGDLKALVESDNVEQLARRSCSGVYAIAVHAVKDISENSDRPKYHLPRELTPVLSLSALAGCGVFLRHAGGWAISGISRRTPFMSGTVGVSMLVCAVACWRFHPEEMSRHMQRTSAIALAFCGTARLLELVLGGTPAGVAVHFMSDALTYPLLIRNLGFLGGASESQICPCIMWSMLSCLLFSATGATHSFVPRFAALSCGSCSMVLAIQSVNQIGELAEEISPSNQTRSHVAGQALIIGWAVCPTVLALGTLDVMTTTAQLDALAVADFLSKAGVAHASLRSRVAIRYSELLAVMDAHP